MQILFNELDADKSGEIDFEERQQTVIKRRAFTTLAVGTAVVLIFSDPMVDVMSEIGARTGISPFYVSFVLAPLASNASELLASFYYAQKKTRNSITISFTALEGAASMNNTFCLSIFMGLIYFKGIAWQYSAETIAIVFVQLAVGAVLTKKTLTMRAPSCSPSTPPPCSSSPGSPGPGLSGAPRAPRRRGGPPRPRC
ncbi:calcium:sodium antiporter [Aureococcus anophagefferens]|nr:calcium:sodium antiporter [Aureococcus anophagefferens]